MKYGIIGNGVVGNATATIFETIAARRKEEDKNWVSPSEAIEVLRFDKDPSRSVSSFDAVVESDYVFICVPTPASGRGPLDMTYLYQVAGMIREFKPTCAVIRSTVNVGITRDFRELTGWPTLFWPEFLSERSAIEDAMKPPLTLLGACNQDADQAAKFASQLTSIFGKLVRWELPEDVELTKLLSNAAGAVQVALANEIRDLCIQTDTDWPTIRDSLVNLGRILPAYSSVPGPDGRRGFGGKCFPKDIAAAASLGSIREATLLLAAIERNKLDRRD